MMDPMIGEIAIFPYEYEPTGWLRCDGQILAVSSYTALFTLLGKRFGGDGSVTFALPKMAPLPTAKPGATLGYFIATFGPYPGRDTGRGDAVEGEVQ